LSIVIGAGVLLEIVSLFHLDFSLSYLVSLFVFSFLAFLLELMPVYLQEGVAISISFALVYAALLLFSPYFAATVAFMHVFCHYQISLLCFSFQRFSICSFYFFIRSSVSGTGGI
ncbi:MAG TPA: hypothetical protein PK844_02765, partial [Candidatus Atribacteria bacterium]|nr:hypothetical protein [Candidatus Atribacteria bacterium]